MLPFHTMEGGHRRDMKLASCGRCTSEMAACVSALGGTPGVRMERGKRYSYNDKRQSLRLAVYNIVHDMHGRCCCFQAFRPNIVSSGSKTSSPFRCALQHAPDICSLLPTSTRDNSKRRRKSSRRFTVRTCTSVIPVVRAPAEY